MIQELSKLHHHVREYGIGGVDIWMELDAHLPGIREEIFCIRVAGGSATVTSVTVSLGGFQISAEETCRKLFNFKYAYLLYYYMFATHPPTEWKAKMVWLLWSIAARGTFSWEYWPLPIGCDAGCCRLHLSF